MPTISQIRVLVPFHSCTCPIFSGSAPTNGGDADAACGSSAQDWQDKFNLEKGSCFGLSHTFLQLGFLRPHNQVPTRRSLLLRLRYAKPGTDSAISYACPIRSPVLSLLAATSAVRAAQY